MPIFNLVTIYDNTPIFSWQSIKETLLKYIREA